MVRGLEGRDIWSQAHTSWVAFACFLSPWPSFCSSPTGQNFLRFFSFLPSSLLVLLLSPPPRISPTLLFLIDPSHLPGPINLTSVPCHGCSHSESPSASSTWARNLIKCPRPLCYKNFQAHAWKKALPSLKFAPYF